MEETASGDVFRDAVTEEEWSQIPSEIGDKLSKFVVEKIEELLTTKALSETNKHNSEETVNELAEKLKTTESALSESNLKLEISSRTIAELESQVSTCTTEITKFQTTCNRYEGEAAEFRHQRNLAYGERDEAAKTLERCSAEVERLQMEVTSLTKQLQSAINAKCEALAENNEVASMKLSLKYKEKHLDQDRAMLKNQIAVLTQSLNERTDELLNIKKDTSLRCVQLEGKLMEKSQELAVALESVKSMTTINSDLTNKIEELSEKYRVERDNDGRAHELYMQELEAQTKLADLYKGMSDNNKQHSEELERAVTELQTFLQEATEKYGELETKFKETQLSNEEIVNKKNECITVLKQELDTSTEMFKMLKDEGVTKEIEGISPTAATASRLIKPGMSLTQIYTQYVNVNEEMRHEKEENARLNSYIQNIINELEDKGPLLRKQREDYENAVETIKDISEQNAALTMENQQLKEESLQCKREENNVSRVNARLKKEVADLSRQVCHLLREVEHSRAGISSSTASIDQDMSDSMSSGDIITKRLVTFNDITELQTTNQRLLSLVRELSSKQEEAEAYDPAAIAQLKMKLESMKETQGTLLEQQDSQNKMMSMVIGQRDMYKTLYEQATKGTGDELPMQLDRDRDSTSQSSKQQDDSDSHSDDKMQDMINQLEKAKKEVETLKEENESYRKEKSANEKILIKQMEEMRKEVREVTKQNCKLTAATEVKDERFKIIQSNVEVYKTQIAALEKQNKIYSESIVRHEQMASYLKDETLQAQTRLSKAEVQLANMEKENSLLYDKESWLSKEVEFFKKEAHTTTLLQTNIELIKATLERNEAEGRIRLEERLNDAYRECAALRRRLQEEQDRFRELGDHLEKQTRAAQAQMEEERTLAEKLRNEITETREDLMSKQVQIEELTKTIKNSLLTIPEGSVEGSKFHELEKMLRENEAEVASLKAQLKTAKETVEQHLNVAEGSEKQLLALVEEQDSYRKATEAKLKERESRILKLEEQCSELQGELSIQTDGPDMAAMELRNRLHRTDEEFKNTKMDLEDAKKSLDVAQSEVKELTSNLEKAENKYTHEMMLHSNDLQVLTTTKEELTAVLSEIEGLKHARDQAITALEEMKQGAQSQNEYFKTEKEQLQQRFKDVNNQNSLLLDQIQALNLHLGAIQAQATEQNTSFNAGDTSLINRSFTEDEVKSSEQLLKIIKYLRQEKDISVSKCDILEAEHIRLKSQYDLLVKQLEDAKSSLYSEREKSEISMVTAARHTEVLRKIETLNAITDSNRTLRQERDALVEQINELKTRTFVLEEQVAPLQEKNKELGLKAEMMQTENVTLRGEATRWRQRANMLIEKSNRTSPEDWKKLQNERENLAKQLTIERGTTAKLNDELNTTRHDKGKLDEQLRTLRFQHNQLSEELEKTKDELKDVKEQINNVMRDLDQTKQNYANVTEEKTKLERELEQRNEAIGDLKSNLLAVRKIAKKYKQQCEDLTKEIEVVKAQSEEKTKNEALANERQEQVHADARSELEGRLVQLEQVHNEKMDVLNQQVSSASEETDNYKKEIESLKQSSLDKEERFKTLFKNAKERIVLLTEQNNILRAELSERSDAQESEKSSQVDRLIKEKEELLAEKQQEKDRFTNEVETLTQRINQLQRQLGQQNSKPSTSSGTLEKTVSEPPTANIKPMAGHLTNTQTQSIQIQPWRSGPETPLASIRPMSMQVRTVAVLPTSQGASTSQGPSAALVPPQQVHTTGPTPSNIEQLSSSPTSSHTEYMPATSSATPTAVGLRQVAVPPTQSTQDTEDEDNNMQVQPAPQQQAVALVLPRVEQPNNGPAQESGTSSSSSNTVTTTQAGLKRPRDADTECQIEEPGKSQQQIKRTRMQQGTVEMLQSHGTVTDSGLEVEYQVPTSSQRDHEEDTDAVIVVESDDDGDGPDEGEGDDDGDDPDTEGYDMEEQELNYDEDMEEEEGGNEVEVVEDSNEVPNQSERSIQEGALQEENSEQPQSEAISSGTDGTSGVTVSQASPSVAVTMPSFSRTRPVAPLSRQQQQSHLLLPHGMDEGVDDGIVPSTPTLFPPRRSDGFGEAVSSPHVPTGSRFTYESTPSNNSGSTEVVPEQTLEFSHTDDNSTGRSVPSTPLQASPQESGPGGEEQNSRQSTNSEPEIPTITISGASEEAESVAEGSISDCMGPPSVAGTSGEGSAPSEQHEEMLENEDGVTSEGEKPPASEESEEEGREAEATPSTNTRLRSSNLRGSVARRSIRSLPMRGNVGRSGPTPIIWNDQHHHSRHQQFIEVQRGRGHTNFPPRVARRSRGRSPRTPYGRF